MSIEGALNHLKLCVQSMCRSLLYNSDITWCNLMSVNTNMFKLSQDITSVHIIY